MPKTLSKLKFGFDFFREILGKSVLLKLIFKTRKSSGRNFYKIHQQQPGSLYYRPEHFRMSIDPLLPRRFLRLNNGTPYLEHLNGQLPKRAFTQRRHRKLFSFIAGLLRT